MAKIISLTVILAQFGEFSSAQTIIWPGQTVRREVTASAGYHGPSWSSDNPTLSLSGGGFYCDITPTAYFGGTATITCTYCWDIGTQHNPDQKSRYDFVCGDNPLVLITKNITLSPGEVGQIRWSFKYTTYMTPSMQFTGYDNETISVDNNGTITALQPGTTTIWIKSNIGTNSEPCQVTVREINCQSVSIPNEISLYADAVKTISYTPYPNNATINSESWYSDNQEIVKINRGTISPINPGETEIYCIINGTITSNKCKVTVFEPNFSLKSQFPENNDIVSIFAQPSIEFSHNIAKGEKFENINLISGAFVIEGYTDIRSNKLTFYPNHWLDPNKSYVFSVPNGSVKNTWGTDFPQDITINFVTGNMEKLTLSSNIKEGIVAEGSKISLLSSVTNANIYYTLDGSIPTKNSQIYLQPITVTDNICIKAIAIKDGYLDSDIFSARYIISSNADNDSPNYLTVTTIDNVDQRKEIIIELNNPTCDVTLAKFDMYLPDGLKVNDEISTKIYSRSSSNETSHEIYSTELADDCWRFIVCDIKNEPIASTLESIRIPIIVDNNYDKGNVFLNDIKLVTQNQNFYLPPAVGGGVSASIPIVNDDSGLLIYFHENSLSLSSKNDTNVIICDITGRLIMSFSLNANETKDIELESGYYFINNLKIKI